MARVAVTADIHGNYKALKQCLERSKFDYELDTLIVLGDTVDGYPDTYLCFEELLKIKNLIYIQGNHDLWAYKWMVLGKQFKIEDRQQYDAWYYQGGKNTIKSYDKYNEGIVPESHRKLLRISPFYYINNNRLFIHGGYNPNKSIEETTPEYLVWDRSIIDTAREIRTNNTINDLILNQTKKLEPYSEVYIGHTDMSDTSKVPVNIVNLWCIDTGSGWKGRLSFMDIDTKEIWQSDECKELYERSGR